MKGERGDGNYDYKYMLSIYMSLNFYVLHFVSSSVQVEQRRMLCACYFASVFYVSFLI